MQLTEGTLLQEGKYRIEGILGQGGFGITYKAIMQVEVKGPLGIIQTEIHVAIKEFFMKDLCNRDEQTCQVSVPSSGSMQQVESYRKKFWKEARNLSKLSHPNIVKVLDVFNENNTSYYVMEYISGGSLQQYVKQQGAIPEETALTYIWQLASALDYMHQNHVCHLDLKPGNVLMDDKKSQVKLIDFGLSKQYDDEGGQTSSTPVGVSEGYAPMEQYELGGVSEFSPATDIYSLGATLFFLLSGVKPPKASLVLNEGLPELPATISAGTRHTIETAMNPRRKDRPQTIRIFLALLNYTEEEIVIESRDEDTINPPKEQLPPLEQPSSNNKSPIFIGVIIALLFAAVAWFIPKSGEPPLKGEVLVTEAIPTENNPVDLGLSVKWAAYNVGASSPEEYGELYEWADPTGEKKSTNSNDSLSTTPPFNISGTQYDIARAKWGKKWRLPTQQELKELSDKCIWKWTEYKKVAGYMVTGPNGNRIFLPASGSCDYGKTVYGRVGGTVYGRGKNGRYWSGTRKTANGDSSSAFSLVFSINGWSPLYSDFCKEGNSVRPVSE